MRRSIWDRLAWMYDRTFSFWLSRDLSCIEELGDFKPEDTVLDFGGGTGRVAQAIQNRVARVVVADAAPRMVERAKAKGLEAALVSGLPTAFPDASFDKILVIEAFHHMPDHDTRLREFHRLLKPGGALVIEEPNPRSWIRFFFWIERFMEATVYHAPEELRQMLSRRDFRVDAERRQGFRYFIRAFKR